MDLKLNVKQQRDRADRHVLLGILWARITRVQPHIAGSALADIWIAQLDAKEAEEEDALQAAIDRAGAFA